MAVIRVSGDLCSGKTTLCEKLSQVTGYPNYYTGRIMRQIAKERGQNIDDFFSDLEKEPELERAIDAKQEQLMLATDKIIVQGRMAPHLKCGFHSVNVYIAVDEVEGARRALNRPEYKELTLGEMIEKNRKRTQTERERYFKLYGIIDHLDRSRFNILVDTTHIAQGASLIELLAKLIPLIKK